MIIQAQIEKLKEELQSLYGELCGSPDYCEECKATGRAIAVLSTQLQQLYNQQDLIDHQLRLKRLFVDCDN